jgi:carbamate kinase
MITHGNGPQIGNLLIQQEEAKAKVPPLPMDFCGAMTQGGIGYMLQQVLHNLFRTEGMRKDVLSVINQILVDEQDPAFENPSKPVGPFYDEEGRRDAEKKGYTLKEVRVGVDRPFRRVVASPNPLRILEAKAIKCLVDAGIVTIAGGGGGIPVLIDSKGDYQGAEAVIDKDLAAEKLAEAIMADILLILTDVEKIYLKFGTPDQKSLELVHLEEGKSYLRAGHFAAGSMGPKVEACLRFVEFGGERAIITSLDKAFTGLHGETGTHFIP